MNEKIKEIAVQAKVEHCISHVRLQEFAELLIKEGAKVVYSNPNIGTSLAASNMMKHFGIE